MFTFLHRQTDWQRERERKKATRHEVTWGRESLVPFILILCKNYQISILTARVNMNVWPTGGLHRTEKNHINVSSTMDTIPTTWFKLKTLQLSHTTYSMYFTTANVNITDHFPIWFRLNSIWNTYAVSFLWGKFHHKTGHEIPGMVRGGRENRDTDLCFLNPSTRCVLLINAIHWLLYPQESDTESIDFWEVRRQRQISS